MSALIYDTVVKFFDKQPSLTRKQPYYVFKLPFGEVIGTGVGGRSASQGYVSESVRQGFTLYERDDETGLNYAKARYMSSAQGRFTSVDPIHVTPRRMIDPQQFNLYAYCRNNPLNYIDPDGMDNVPSDFKSFDQLSEKQRQLLMGYFKTTDAKVAAQQWTTLTQQHSDQAASFLGITNALSKITLDLGGGKTANALDALTSIKDLKGDRVYGTLDGNIVKQWQGAGKGGYTITFPDGKTTETKHATFNKGEFLVASRHDNPFDPKPGKPGQFNKFDVQGHTDDTPRVQWNYTYATNIVDIDIDFYASPDPRHKTYGNSLVTEHYDDYVKKFGNPGFSMSDGKQKK